MADLRALVWGENLHEREDPRVRDLYPDGMHAHIAAHLDAQVGIQASCASLEEPEHGLSEERLRATDVLLWWGHKAHDQVADAVVERVQTRILEGMGLIALHSAHYSKVLRRALGTACSLRWREVGERERLWVVDPTHPIVAGLDECIEIPRAEMYGEPFAIPRPDELIFISWFEGGEVFRSGATWRRGHGRIFYFRPGHETYPIYHQQEIMLVLSNAVRWARQEGVVLDRCPRVAQPRERLGRG